MFQDNLISLRKLHGFSQDELAEKIGVTRQTLSKYETGESLPDIERCKRLADIFGVSMDDLVNYEKTDRENLGLEVPPKGKHVFGMVYVLVEVNDIAFVYRDKVRNFCQNTLFVRAIQ